MLETDLDRLSEPQLRIASSEGHVREAIKTFNEIATSWAHAKRLARATTYWVFDPAGGAFGPSKFVGYVGLTGEAYRIALRGNAGGAAFDGGTTKRAIAKVVGTAFESSVELSAKLIGWAESRFGLGALDGVDQSKWRFIRLSDGPASLSDLASSARSLWAFFANPNVYRIEDAVKARSEDAWITAGYEIQPSDGVLIWRGRGKDGRKGVVAFGVVTTQPVDSDDSENPFWLVARSQKRESRVSVRYIVPNSLPLWLDQHESVLGQLSVSRARGGTVFKVTPEQWTAVLALVEHPSAIHGPNRGIGRPYVFVGRVKASAARDPFAVDPDKVDRGNQAHADVQDRLALFLLAQGLDPRSPDNGEPDFDLAWETNSVIHVAEIKSITDENEEKQLRLGLGQVLRYRQQLARPGRRVIAVLVPERQPADPSWELLCVQHEVTLAWPTAFGRRLSVAL